MYLPMYTCVYNMYIVGVLLPTEKYCLVITTRQTTKRIFVHA